MEKLKVIFKRIREDLKANVPPLNITVDQEHHFEVWYTEKNKKHFFASVILHQDFVQLTFFPDVPNEVKAVLYPEDIYKRMGAGFTCQIKDLSPELESNIKEVVSNLLDFIKKNML